MHSEDFLHLKHQRKYHLTTLLIPFGEHQISGQRQFILFYYLQKDFYQDEHQTLSTVWKIPNPRQ